MPTSSRPQPPGAERQLQRIPFPIEDTERSVPDRFEAVVDRQPDRPAVVAAAAVLTFEQLDRAANRVANAILARCERPVTVAFLMEHGADQIVAMLGILKAGAGYVPLDPAYPASALTAVLAASEAAAIVTNRRQHEIAACLGGGRRVLILVEELAAPLSDERPRCAISPDDLATVYYTSGSTGEPKGVMQDHRNNLHFMMTVGERWPLLPEDRVAHLTPCAFSAAAMSVLGPLLNGAAVAAFDVKRAGLAELTRWLAAEEITILFAVPSLFRGLVATLDGTQRFPALRLVALGGEPLHRRDHEDFMRCFPPPTELRNLLAGAEMLYIRDFVMRHDTRLPGAQVPAGYAVAGKEVRLHGDDGREVEAGETGEIVVSGRYLSPGYWRRPDLTAAAFSGPSDGLPRSYRTGDLGTILADGCLVHLGRKDSMVKVRGQRVELAQVESALHDLAGIREAAVIAENDEKGSAFLTAYVVPETGQTPDAGELRGELRKTLAEVAVPAFLVVVESLPRTGTGKIDRGALPRPLRDRSRLGTPLLPPQDELEALIAGACEWAVGCSPIGAADNLLDLGLDSIGYVALLAEIERRTEHAISPDAVPDRPSVRVLAALVRGQTPAGSDLAPAGRRPGVVESVRSALRRWAEAAARVAVPVAAAIVPYRGGFRLLLWLCRRSLLQATVLRRPARRMRSLLHQLSPEADAGRAVAGHLAYGVGRLWIYGSLGRCGAEEFARRVTIRGEERLRAALAGGRGVVVLNSHLTLAHLALAALHRLGVREVASIQTDDLHLELLGGGASGAATMQRVTAASASLRARSLYAARKTLTRGGVVHTAGDGYQGSSGVQLPFFGRLRPFMSGFAELAMDSGAVVLPVVVRGGEDGSVTVEFREPLPTGDVTLSRGARVELLLNGYAALLRQLWIEDPSQVTRLHVRRFLRLPAAGPEPHQGGRRWSSLR